ncbi:carbohydrate ABC transporter permease [Paenibacillus sp. SAF-054]|uniref:carbohydrate ABC transporter permease n=1 Tax=unclassified Paenibacillus TaxID=185978 RepID=UPI003F7E7417
MFPKIMSKTMPSGNLLSRAQFLVYRMRMLLLGKESDKGLLFKIFIYLILIDTAYIFLRPILFMITKMITSPRDATNPVVTWVPTELYWGHLESAWKALNYMKSLAVSVGISTVSALLTVMFCSIAGYAFARLQIPFKRTLFTLLLFALILPAQVTILPLMSFYTMNGMYNTVWPLLLPAFFGHGLKGALFVIIFRQFFSTLPKELEEAARIDGASVFRIYGKVILPLAQPAILVVFLFSFVWTWNDAYLPGMFMPRPDFPDVPQLSMGIEALNSYIASLQQNPDPSGEVFFPDLVKMAAFFLIIMPPLVLYIIAQRWFIEGVERTGLVE